MLCRSSGGFPELDSKYRFGSFTRGASVGDQGERAIEPGTIANFGKRSGQYAATLTELELEYSPTRFLQLEFGPTVSYYNIRGAPGLNDRNAGVVNGFNGTIRSLLIAHGQSPFEVTLSVEPEWHNFDQSSGDTASNYALEKQIEADAELIKNQKPPLGALFLRLSQHRQPSQFLASIQLSEHGAIKGRNVAVDPIPTSARRLCARTMHRR
jgi:hypothetical protein